MENNYKVLRIILICFLILLYYFEYITIGRIEKFFIIIVLIYFYFKFGEIIYFFYDKKFQKFFNYYYNIRIEERRKNKKFKQNIKYINIFIKIIYIIYILINPILFLIIKLYIKFYYFFRGFNGRFFKLIGLRELIYFIVVNMIIFPVFIIHGFGYRILERGKEIGIINIFFKRAEGLVYSIFIFTPIIDNIIYYFGGKNIIFFCYIILIIIGYNWEGINKNIVINKNFDLNLIKITELRNENTKIGYIFFRTLECIGELGEQVFNNIFFVSNNYNSNEKLQFEREFPICYKKYMIREIKYKPSPYLYSILRTSLDRYSYIFGYNILGACKKENKEFLGIEKAGERLKNEMKNIFIEMGKMDLYINRKNYYKQLKFVVMDENNREKQEFGLFVTTPGINSFDFKNNKKDYEEYLNRIEEISKYFRLRRKEYINEVSIRLIELEKIGKEIEPEHHIIIGGEDEKEKKKKLEFYRDYENEMIKGLDELKKEGEKRKEGNE